jgi:hypothetical protein
VGKSPDHFSEAASQTGELQSHVYETLMAPMSAGNYKKKPLPFPEAAF